MRERQIGQTLEFLTRLGDDIEDQAREQAEGGQHDEAHAQHRRRQPRHQAGLKIIGYDRQPEREASQGEEAAEAGEERQRPFVFDQTGDQHEDAPTIAKGPHFAFDLAAANKLLDDAGWTRGSDGIRAKDGYRMHLLYQTSINGPRQKTQAIIKQAAAKAGIELELKGIAASVFFSGDVGNTDTDAHFYADIEEYAFQSTTPDPADWMQQYASWQIAQKDNKWSGQNYSRWHNQEFDDLFNKAKVELDPVKRAAMFIRMNDLVVADNVLPVIQRGSVTGQVNTLHTVRSGWDNDMGMLSDWWKDA